MAIYVHARVYRRGSGEAWAEPSIILNALFLFRDNVTSVLEETRRLRERQRRGREGEEVCPLGIYSPETKRKRERKRNEEKRRKREERKNRDFIFAHTYQNERGRRRVASSSLSSLSSCNFDLYIYIYTHTQTRRSVQKDDYAWCGYIVKRL